MAKSIFNKKFISRVQVAEKRIDAGQKVSFKSINQMDKYLDTMEE